MSSYSYENIKHELHIRGCELLTSKEELNTIIENAIRKNNIKINYIASCGHSHQVFFNVFKSRGTGIICSSCKNKEIGNNKKEKINNGELTKLNCLESEFNFITLLINLVEKDFNISKAFDGCKVDLIYKPNNINHDKWVGIQVKTCETIHLTYSFHIDNNLYDNCLIMLFCHEDKGLWIIPENTLGKQKKISIGLNKSKYNIYKINIENVCQKLLELYDISSKFAFDQLNTPKNIYQIREQEFRKYREKNISFLNFIYPDMEGLCYDFKVNNYNIQEKVFSKDKSRNNYYIVNICKNYLSKNINKKRGQYDIGDNDYYWINCNDKIYFFVIPENILIEKGYVGNTYGSIFFRVNPENLNERTDWLQPYLFNYQTINEIENKNRLLKLLNFN